MTVAPKPTWTELADQFAALTTRYKWGWQNLRAHWRRAGFDDTGVCWKFVHQIQGVFDFQQVTRRAVDKLGQPDGDDAFARWFERIHQDVPPPGWQTRGDEFISWGVDRLSVDACRKYAVDEELRAGTSRARRAPKDKRYPERATWLCERITGQSGPPLSKIQRLKIREFADEHRFEARTLVEMIELGRGVQEDVLDRLVDVLKVTRRDIPDK